MSQRTSVSIINKLFRPGLIVNYGGRRMKVVKRLDDSKWLLIPARNSAKPKETGNGT